MTDATTPVSKVLVLEGQDDAAERIKSFCDRQALVALKSQAYNVMAVLRSNVDLGGILLWEHYGGRGDGLGLALEIHRVRPELPILLRRDAADAPPLSPRDRRIVHAEFTLDALDDLKPVVDAAIFSRVYPNALVRGIAEITTAALQSQFRDVQIECEAPTIVRDRLIHGELFSLIPLETPWCRGYMMMQVEERPLMALVRSHKTYLDEDEAETDFREINHLLGEVTNLTWGAFKNRFVVSAPRTTHLTQVPIIVNHFHRYISFGAEDPQLCFRYTMTDREHPNDPLVLSQRFVFNLSWSPEDFAESEASVDDLVDAGELELF